MKFCENRAADSVIGYYCALAKRENIPFQAQANLPLKLPVDEIDMCLVLSNLLENALEASLKTARDKRQINVMVSASSLYAVFQRKAAAQMPLRMRMESLLQKSCCMAESIPCSRNANLLFFSKSA